MVEKLESEGVEPDTLEPHILELRIHGIANAPPEVMLGVERDEIESLGGDELGGFWTYKKAPRTTDRTEPVGLHENQGRTDDREEIRTEAYSWGNMVRSGGSIGSRVNAVMVQIGWLLTLPFALCNVAYWTRRIVRKADGDREWLAGPGAGTIRLFALGLTLLLTSALATVTLDLIGTQCFQANAICAGLPEAFHLLPMDAHGRPLRIALLSLVVLAVIVLLHVITRRTRVRYEAGLRDWAQSIPGPQTDGLAARQGKEDAGEARVQTPLLASSGFWASTRVGQTAESLHIAASIALLVGLLAWDRAFATTTACHELQGFLADGQCSLSAIVAASPFELTLIVIAALVLIGITGLSIISTAQSRRWITRGRRLSWLLLGLAGLSYVAYLGKVVWDFRPDATGHDDTEVSIFLGLTVVPTVLVSLLVIGCVAALWWRHHRHGGWWGLLPLGAMGILTWSGLAQRFDSPLLGAIDPSVGIWVGSILISGYIACAVTFALRNARTRFEAWWGFGGSVALALALTAALLLTCLMVFGVRALVLPASVSSKVEGQWRIFEATGAGNAGTVPQLPDRLVVPAIYELFGVALIAMVVIVVLVAGIAALAQWLRPYRLLSTPGLSWPEDTSDRRRAFDAVRMPGTVQSGYPEIAPKTDDPIDRHIESKRRLAAFAQRGEPLVGLIATVAVLFVLWAVVFSFAVRNGSLDSAGEPWLAVLDAVIAGSLTLMIAGAATSVVLVVANAVSSKERPLGLLWDILCFFPRAGHPFAPPCYGERAIPELSTRTRDWLDASGHSQRKVVFSAHSMGGVLAIATIFATVGQDDGGRPDVRGRVGLVTFGVQLRAYFSRIFPDVLGPDVLGVPPLRGPRLFTSDPWRDQVLSEYQSEGQPPRGFELRYEPSMSEVLGGRPAGVPAWISLWRRTDFLGFPVHGYLGGSESPQNPIDRGATESNPRSYLWNAAMHSGYQFTLQYRVALHTVISRIERAEDSEGSRRSGRSGRPDPRDR